MIGRMMATVRAWLAALRVWLAKLWRSLRAAARAFRLEWNGPSAQAEYRVWVGPTLDQLLPVTPLLPRKVALYRYADLVTEDAVRAIRVQKGELTIRERQK